VRDADNGAEFVRAAERRTRMPIRKLSGADEARLSALGVIAGIPEADGIAGDLGGGSLELVRVRRGDVGAHATLPLGPLRLREAEPRGKGKMRDLIERHLDELAWLDDAKGRAFYGVGGAWRALARVHMEHVDYPLHVIHHYTLARDRAEEFCDLIAGLSRESLERIAGVSRKRVDTLPIAALVLECVLARARPAQLVFGATGLREGCIFAALPAAERRRDPLIAACEAISAQGARFRIDGHALFDWAGDVFRKAPKPHARLRLAACLLSDIAWREHPDYRADLAFLRTLRLPVTGIDHPGRAFVALAVYTRYEGRADGEVTRPSWMLLDDEMVREGARPRAGAAARLHDLGRRAVAAAPGAARGRGRDADAARVRARAAADRRGGRAAGRGAGARDRQARRHQGRLAAARAHSAALAVSSSLTRAPRATARDARA
jgi:exopolyphosphatase/guanosine-5'-triphosphate,3'-diphosphate pyrophosphatase